MTDLIQLVPVSAVPSDTQMDEIVGDLAVLMGSPEDPEVREMVLRALDRAATRLNMAGIGLCQVREFTATTFTVGQYTLDISSLTDWLSPWGNVLLYGTDGGIGQEVYWVPWGRLRETQDQYAPTTTDVPEYCSIQYPDQQLIHFNTTLDPGVIGRVVVPYMARVPRPSRASSLAVPEEVLEALQEGATYFLMRQRFKNQPPIWLPYERTFAAALLGAKQSVNRVQDSQIYSLFRLEATI